MRHCRSTDSDEQSIIFLMMSQKKISETRQKDFQKTAEERVRNFFKEHSELRKQSRQNRTLHTQNSTLSPTAPPCLPKLGVTNANINEVFKFLAKKIFTLESTYKVWETRDDRGSVPKTGQWQQTTIRLRRYCLPDWDRKRNPSALFDFCFLRFVKWSEPYIVKTIILNSVEGEQTG